MSGYERVGDRLPERLRAALVDEAGRYAFAPPHPRAGGAFTMASFDSGAVLDVVRWVGALAAARGFGDVAPNEASFQRYGASGNGLPPHRDQRYYAHYVAIVTVEGSATFAAHRGRAVDDVEEEWLTTPGEVILLRGWAPGCEVDPRPYHRVDPPTAGSRLMFQLRHNLGADGAGPWPAELTGTEREQALELARAAGARRRAG